MTKEDIAGMEWCGEYINHKRFKTSAGNKHYNFRRGTRFRCDETGLLYHDNEDGSSDLICFFSSENAMLHFVPLIDDKWEERGELHSKIWDKFTSPRTTQEVREKMFTTLGNDSIAKKYEKPDTLEGNWEWERHKLNYAPLYDLNHIWELLKNIK